VEVPTNCFETCAIGYYHNYPVSNALGAFCFPTDQAAKQALYYNTGLYLKYNSIKAIQYLLIGLAVTLGLSFIWMLVVLCLPRISVWIGIILALALFLITALVLFTSRKTTLVDA